MKPMDEETKTVYEYLKSHIQEHGEAPTQKEVMGNLKICQRQLNRTFDSLLFRKKISVVANGRRAIEILDKKEGLS